MDTRAELGVNYGKRILIAGRGGRERRVGYEWFKRRSNGIAEVKNFGIGFGWEISSILNSYLYLSAFLPTAIYLFLDCFFYISSVYAYVPYIELELSVLTSDHLLKGPE